jgi:hypothetical protein
MNTHCFRPGPIVRFGSLCISSALLTLASAASMAAAGTATTPATPTAEIQARYEQERAKCLDGSSNQDRATCLKEAGAARDAAKHGQLDDGDARYRRNARDRCNALTGDEARDCVARMSGKGTTSGSAQGGGIYRETVTREVKPVDAPAAAASAP